MNKFMNNILLSICFIMGIHAAESNPNKVKELEGPQPRHKSINRLMSPDLNDPEEIFLRSLEEQEKNKSISQQSKSGMSKDEQELFYTPFVQLNSSLKKMQDNLKFMPEKLAQIDNIIWLRDFESYNNNIMRNWMYFIQDYENKELSTELQKVFQTIKKLFDQYNKTWNTLYPQRDAQLLSEYNKNK